MGIQPESSHHEEGPGQNEIDFRYSDPLTAADNAMTFQTVVKTIARRNVFADGSGERSSARWYLPTAAGTLISWERFSLDQEIYLGALLLPKLQSLSNCLGISNPHVLQP
mgnify:CR=1 FL=1